MEGDKEFLTAEIWGRETKKVQEENMMYVDLALGLSISYA